MDFSQHARDQWMIRGDFTRRLSEVWEEGIEVECPHKHYDRARLDAESDTILLASPNKVKTVITVFETTNFTVKHPVVCFDCGHHHHSQRRCGECGSTRWRCR